MLLAEKSSIFQSSCVVFAAMVSRTSSSSHERTPGQHLAAACCLPQLQSQPPTRRCSSNGSLNGNSNRRSNGSWSSGGSFAGSSRAKAAPQGLLALLSLVVMCCFIVSSIILSGFGNTDSKEMLEQRQHMLRLIGGDSQGQRQQQQPVVAQSLAGITPAGKAAAVAAMQLSVSRRQAKSLRLKHHDWHLHVGQPQWPQHGQEKQVWQQHQGHVQSQHTPAIHLGPQPTSAPATALLIPDEPAPARIEAQPPPSSSEEPQVPDVIAESLQPAATSRPTSLHDASAELHLQEQTSLYAQSKGVKPQGLKYPLWWHGPIWSGSGYGSEATNFVLSLLRTGRLASDDLWVNHHGDDFRKLVVESLSEADRQELMLMQSLPAKYRGKRAAVVVCHSVPTNWVYPEPMWAAGAPCPPNPAEHAWVYQIGRTMFETDKLPAIFVPRLNAMNEIWVPSRWQLDTFVASGVNPEKLVIVPEGVNTTLFDPAKHTALDLASRAQLVFGRPWQDKQAVVATAAADDDTSAASNLFGQGRQLQDLQDVRRSLVSTSWAAGSTADASALANGSSTTTSGVPSPSIDALHDTWVNSSSSRRPFRFISTFKWEQRKGWPILLEAYLSEFTAEDDVELYILTQPFEKSGAGFQDKMRSWADQLYHSASAISTQRNRQQQQEASVRQADTEAILEATLQAAAEAQAVEESHTARRRLLLDSPETSSTQTQTQTRMAALPARRFNSPDAGSAGNADGYAVHGHDHQLHNWHESDDKELDSSLPEDVAVEPADDKPDGSHPDDQSQEVHAASIIRQIQSFAQSLQSMPTRLGNPADQAVMMMTATNGQPSSSLVQPQQLEQHKRSLLSSLPSRPLQPGAAAADQPGLPDAPPAAPSLTAAAATEAARYPTLYVVDSHISDEEFPAFYKAGDAFVLPTRGEGWGRPHVEAMSMGLPVISTNWSGITAYLDESVGYPIAVEKLVPVPSETMGVTWWFQGLKWAQPSLSHLRQLMRQVYTNKEEAAARGAAARARMVSQYSPESIADAVLKELNRIEKLIP